MMGLITTVLAAGLAGGGGGPHDPAMDARVTALEVGMKDLKATLVEMKVSLAGITATLGSLATKADIATSTGASTALAEKVAAQGARLSNVEAAINETIKSAIGKAIGPWQLPMIVAACFAIAGVSVGVWSWMTHQSWFPH